MVAEIRKENETLPGQIRGLIAQGVQVIGVGVTDPNVTAVLSCVAPVGTQEVLAWAGDPQVEAYLTQGPVAFVVGRTPKSVVSGLLLQRIATGRHRW